MDTESQLRYYFNEKVAEDVGVEEAIMYSNIKFWVEKNKANGNKEKHFHSGSWWTYNSMKAFKKLFTFWSKHQIRRILKNLKEGGYIEKGNFNENKYDQTNWYTVLNKEESTNCENTQMEQAESTNRDVKSNKPIPNNKPNSKPNKKTSSIKEETKPKEYGDEDINWLLNTFEEIRGFESQGRQKKDRYTAKHLLNNFSKKQIEYMLRWLENAKYAPRVGSVEKLWYKKGDIIAGIKEDSKANSSNVATI